MVEVVSSAIAAVDWDNEGLTVVFHKGRGYKFLGVPYGIFEDLTKPGASVGKVYHAKVRGQYDGFEV